MPDLNGDEAVRIIRQDIKSSIPVIATTANPVSADREKLLQLGFNDVLIKPFEQLTLAKTIHGLIPEKIKEAKQDNPMYNLRELELTSRGNSDFVHRMMKVFLFSAESMIKKLQTASTEKNFELRAATAHRLIPSCRQLSINYMTERLKWIENNSRPGLEKELEEKIYELKQHFEAVKFSMEEEFAKNP
jgi:CheY-like chemotaxis protein